MLKSLYIFMIVVRLPLFKKVTDQYCFSEMIDYLQKKEKKEEITFFTIRSAVYGSKLLKGIKTQMDFNKMLNS